MVRSQLAMSSDMIFANREVKRERIQVKPHSGSSAPALSKLIVPVESQLSRVAISAVMAGQQ